MSLVKEFAVEPRVMATWTHFQSLWEDFGVGKGRLIAKYPVLWKQKVADELANEVRERRIGDIRAHTIRSKIGAEDHKFLVKSRHYTNAQDWQGNVRAQMGVDPFHAVIASENPDADPHVLVAGEFLKDQPPYRADSQADVPRSSTRMAECASLLLRYAEQIRLVDPYFEPDEPRFRRVFAAFLRARNPSSPSLRVLEIHRKRPNEFVLSVQRDKYSRHLAGLVPRSLTLRVFFWGQRSGGQAMHARFVLTDLGGLNFENGLDEGAPGTNTLVTLLDTEVFRN